MLFRMCAGIGVAVLLLGVVGLVLVNNWGLEASVLTGPITEEELLNLRDAMISPASATGYVPPAIHTNRLGQS